jgi:hypothetical protein
MPIISGRSLPFRIDVLINTCKVWQRHTFHSKQQFIWKPLCVLYFVAQISTFYDFIPLRILKKIYFTNGVAASLMTCSSFVSAFFIKIKTVANVVTVMTVTWFHLNKSGKSYPLCSCNSL